MELFDQKTLINGIAYSFCDIRFELVGIHGEIGFNGVPVKAINYNSTRSKTPNYNNSTYAISYNYGKKEFSGNCSFTLDSFEALRDASFSLNAKYKSITDLPSVDIVITYSNAGKATIHTLKNVVFTSESISSGEGDDTIGVDCDFTCSFIDYGDAHNLIEVGVIIAATNLLGTGFNDNQNLLAF